MTPTERLAKAFDEHAARVAASVGTLHQEIERLLPELAREQLNAALAKLDPLQPAFKLPKKPRAIVQRDPKPAKKASAPACSKCGEPGHNARTCGKAKAVAERDDDDDDEAPTMRTAVGANPPPCRQARSLRAHRGGRQGTHLRRVGHPSLIGARSSSRCPN